MENRKAIRARVLLKRARARLSGNALGLLEAVLRDAHPTDSRWVIESVDQADGMLRALVTVALFYADVPVIAFQPAFMLAWLENHREVIAVARAEGDCLMDMFRYGAFTIPERIPPILTVYRGARGIGAEHAARGGLSWTTDYGAACLFATGDSFGNDVPTSVVLMRRIRKENILWHVENIGHDEIVHSEGPGGEVFGDIGEYFEMADHWVRRVETMEFRAKARIPLNGFQPLSPLPASNFELERAKYAAEAMHADSDWLAQDLSSKRFPNDTYSVKVDEHEDPNYAHISVTRHDAIEGIPWDDLQAIKSQIFGEEAEAVELYPSASRTVNDANVRHMWVNKGSGFGIGWGWR